LGLVLAPALALIWGAALQPLPEPLHASLGAGSTGIRVLDGHGRLLSEVRASDGAIAARVSLSELPPEVSAAVLAAEDARFALHPGVDPLAMLRAGMQLLWHRRIVSGASTITQQLARNVVERPRTLGGKLREMTIALRIEASLSKDQILEEYLNRVEFGANVRGLEAASRVYFDKPARKLSLAESATLAGIPRGPTLYDPRRGLDRVTERRDRVLRRMRDRGFAAPEAVERALAEPIVLQRRSVEGGAPHFLRAVTTGRLSPELSGRALAEVRTTLDVGLQREVETLTRQTAQRIVDYDATAAAVIVLDNATGDVLAYVGSPDYFDETALGQNDGVLALRQPGSTLKPFVYATALSGLGMTAATVLPDVELHLSTPSGDYSPRNYDGRFHGPVRLREALGNSLNIPAVFVAQEVGPAAVLEQLRKVGFDMLDRAPEHYGAAIALGDGEVTLAALAQAYATLARGGRYRPLRAVTSARLASGETLALPPVADAPAMDPDSAALLSDVLSDAAARAAAFGRGNVLELPFEVAVKTGTSKGYRDNWTVGFTREVTVAVWVGNFDGRPMRGSSGVTGAAPLFHDVMLAAMRGRAPQPLLTRPLAQVEICTLSGKRAGPHCRHRMVERFAPSRVVSTTCDMHVQVSIDPESGLRASEPCPRTERVVREVYPPRFARWAANAGRPVVPSNWSARCPGRDDSAGGGTPAVAYPFDGARFLLDPAVPRMQQTIELSARAPSGAASVRFVVDGRVVATVRAPFSVQQPLVRGQHQIVVETTDGRRSEPVRFVVD